jgi:hypothetical protein
VRRRTTPLWWRLGFSILTLLVAVGILATTWSATFASHPAYLITLLVVASAAVVAGVTSPVVRRNAPSDGARRRPGLRRAAHGFEVIGVLVLLGGLLYLRPLTASTVAVDAMAGSPDVTVTDSATRIELRPTGAARATGLVFYPGAKVDPRAYVPNLTPLAAAGYPVIILKLPYNIAFFDPNGAYRAMDAEPAVTRWAVGGHSLGGVLASSVAGSTDVRVRGLLLWASYPNRSIADRAGLQVTSISGSDDALATPAKIDAAKPRLPPDTRYVVIDGGIHSFFGDYGLQSGDGTPSITRDGAQMKIQVASIDLLQRVETGSP